MTHESTPAGTLRLRCMYYSRSPARPYHHSPHTLERPPHAGLFPASRPGQMATQCVAWRPQGVAAATPPRAPPPPDHCHGPHIPERPPHAGGFPASPPGQMATQGVAAATPPRAPRPQTTASTTAPWCSTTAASVLPSPASPPWSPDGGRRASPTGWRSPCYQHHHHHHYTAPPRDRWSPQCSPRHVTVLPALCYPLPGAPLITPRPPCLPGAGPLTTQPLPHATPRAIPIPGGLRSPCRSPSPLGEVYPYERRGWGCAAREWEALTTTITAPRQSREIGRARAMGTLPLRQYLMTTSGS
ncbi:uncharacterized protein LOC135112222 isoform X8 [Scylla paramamosain]|uniref:uncharacterized protein LOC135112222 isoform X8 n=1 Tax=Scylla paramamosain TaxID=85552 RepID=UPI0030839EC4